MRHGEVKEKENWGLLGHEWAVEFLRSTIVQQRTTHAYLLTGPEQVGKRTLALALAAAFNCAGWERDDALATDPCGECLSCRKIQRGVHPDVKVLNLDVQAELLGKEQSKQRELGVGAVRFLQREVSLKPFEGRRKVYVIEEAETLSTEAVNSFLKTLEEPPPTSIFILLSLSEESLLPTLVSRCQVLRLRPLSRRAIGEALRAKFGIDQDRAALIAALSMGRVGWAFDAATNQDLIGQRTRRLSQLVALAASSRLDRFGFAAEMSESFGRGDRDGVFDTLALWSGWWRDILLLKGDCPHLITNVDQAPALTEAAQRYDLEQVVRFVQRIEQTMLQLKQNVSPRLALEGMLLDVPAAAKG